MQRWTHTRFGRALAAWLALLLLAAGCVLPAASTRTAGLPDFQVTLAGVASSPALVSVPGGVYNVAGGNLVLAAADLSADAGRRVIEIARVYNSVTGAWRWNFEASYDGTTFVDETGARYEALNALPDGSPIPGSGWDKLDANSLRTRGGLRYDFDGQGRLASVFWDSPDSPGVRYDWSGGELWIMQCFAATACVVPLFRVVLGPHGPVTVTDERASLVEGTSRRVEYAYDAGRLSHVRVPQDVEKGLPGTQYTYRPVSNLIESAENSEGELVAYGWLGERLAVAALGGFIQSGHRFDYPQVSPDVPGQWIVVHTNPLGGRTRIVYDDLGRWISSERLSAGELALASYTGTSLRPAAITAFDGTTRTIEAYLDDEPIRLRLPSGNVVEVTHEPGGIDFETTGRRAVHETRDSLGVVRTTHYDGAGRPVESENGAGETTRTTYYGGVSESEIVPASGAGMDFALYGIAGHWTRASHSALPGVDLERKLDSVGNPVVSMAGLQRGGVIDREFDAGRSEVAIRLGGLDEQGDLEGSDTLTIARRSDGRPIAVVRPGGLTEHRFAYDARGRIASECDALPGAPCVDATVYGHNEAGQLDEVAWPDGRREEWDFDAYGRRTHHRAYRDGVLEGQRTWVWSQARIVSVADSLANEVVTLGYDAAGRIDERIYAGVAPHAVRYEYDLRSRRTRETLELQGATLLDLAYVYDDADRRIATKELDGTPGGRVLVENEYIGGRVASVDYGNGLTRNYDYDPATGELLGMLMTDESGGAVEDTTLSRLVQANPERFEIRSDTISPLAEFGEEYWLNRPGSLTQDAGKLGMRIFRYRAFDAGATVREESYRWDVQGRMQDDSDGDQFVYDAVTGRLVSANVDGQTTTRGYDASGQVDQLDGHEVVRNALGRIVRIGSIGSPLVTMTWDMAGRRRSVATGGFTRSFSLFDGAVEYDAATGALGWLHLSDVSIALAGPGERYRHRDFRGNTLLTSDESGAIVSHRRYQPFGVDVVAGISGISAADLSGFAGGMEIPGAGLVQLGARAYDPALGLFLSPDPVHTPLNLLNPHGYAHGNPILWWDPDGLHATPTSGQDGNSQISQALGFAAGSFEVIGDALSAGAAIAAYEAAKAAGSGNRKAAARFAMAAAALQAGGQIAKLLASSIRAVKAAHDEAEAEKDAAQEGEQQKELVIEGEAGSGGASISLQAPVASSGLVPGFSLGFVGFGWFAF